MALGVTGSTHSSATQETPPPLPPRPTTSDFSAPPPLPPRPSSATAAAGNTAPPPPPPRKKPFTAASQDTARINTLSDLPSAKTNASASGEMSNKTKAEYQSFLNNPLAHTDQNSGGLKGTETNQHGEMVRNYADGSSITHRNYDPSDSSAITHEIKDAEGNKTLVANDGKIVHLYNSDSTDPRSVSHSVYDPATKTLTHTRKDGDTFKTDTEGKLKTSILDQFKPSMGNVAFGAGGAALGAAAGMASGHSNYAPSGFAAAGNGFAGNGVAAGGMLGSAVGGSNKFSKTQMLAMGLPSMVNLGSNLFALGTIARIGVSSLGALAGGEMANAAGNSLSGLIGGL